MAPWTGPKVTMDGGRSASRGPGGRAVSPLRLAKLGATVKPGADVTARNVSWGQAGGGMDPTVADLGTWAGTGLGTSLLPARPGGEALRDLEDPGGEPWPGPPGVGVGLDPPHRPAHGLGVPRHLQQETGAAFVAIINDTSSLEGPVLMAVNTFPALIGMLGD